MIQCKVHLFVGCTPCGLFQLEIGWCPAEIAGLPPLVLHHFQNIRKAATRIRSIVESNAGSVDFYLKNGSWDTIICGSFSKQGTATIIKYSFCFLKPNIHFNNLYLEKSQKIDRWNLAEVH